MLLSLCFILNNYLTSVCTLKVLCVFFTEVFIEIHCYSLLLYLKLLIFLHFYITKISAKLKNSFSLFIIMLTFGSYTDQSDYGGGGWRGKHKSLSRFKEGHDKNNLRTSALHVFETVTL